MNNNFPKGKTTIYRKGYRMKSVVNISFAELKVRILDLVELTKRLVGFKIPLDVKVNIHDSVKEYVEGKETQAVKLGLDAELHLTNVIIAFFRNSPLFFGKWLEKLRDKHFDADILQKLEKDLGQLERETKVQAQLPVGHCADCYEKVHKSFEWAEDEQKKREINRRKKQEAEEKARLERQKEEQREQEREKRKKLADELLDAFK